MAPDKAKEIETRYVPGVGIGSVPIPDNVRQEIQSKSELLKQVSDLKNWAAKHSGSLDPATMAEGKTKAAQVQDLYRTAHSQGVLKEGEMKFLENIIPSDPSAFMNEYRTNPRYQEVERASLSNLNSLKKMYGLPTAMAMPAANAKVANGYPKRR